MTDPTRSHVKLAAWCKKRFRSILAHPGCHIFSSTFAAPSSGAFPTPRALPRDSPVRPYLILRRGIRPARRRRVRTRHDRHRRRGPLVAKSRARAPLVTPPTPSAPSSPYSRGTHLPVVRHGSRRIHPRRRWTRCGRDVYVRLSSDRARQHPRGDPYTRPSRRMRPRVPHASARRTRKSSTVLRRPVDRRSEEGG